MRDPSSAIAKDIDGAANIITAAICTLTNGQPGGVCHSAGVQAAARSSVVPPPPAPLPRVGDFTPAPGRAGRPPWWLNCSRT